MNKGFTLIEVVVYIALFTLLMGSAFVTMYQLIDGSGKLSAKTVAQQEANFLMGKFNFTLTGINPAFTSTPSASTPTSNTLNVKKYNGDTISIRLNSGKIEIKESTNGNIFLPITSDNVVVNDLEFDYLTPLLGAPAGITATATIDGEDFSITKYFRK